MPVIFRAQKGAPLTNDEVDENFRTPLTRLESLENAKSIPVSIGRIEQIGDKLVITSSQGHHLGDFNLPVISFHPCGAWQPGRSYAVYDVVCHKGSLLCCTSVHIASQDFSQDPAFWQILLEPAMSAPDNITDNNNTSSHMVDLQRLTRLPVYASESLPIAASLGSLALVLGNDEKLKIIISDGKEWQTLNH